MYGEPDINILNKGKDINLKFNGELRDTQKPVANKYLEHVKRRWRRDISFTHGFWKDNYCVKYFSTIKKENNYYSS